MMMAESQKCERLNLRISQPEQKRLQKLMRISQAASITDVIRRALAVYEHLWQAKRGKARIVLQVENEPDKELLLL